MKLLFIVPRFHINLSYRLEALQKAGHDVSLAVLYRGGSESLGSISPAVIGSAFSPHTIPSPIKLLKTIRATHPEVVFIRGYKSFFTLIAIVIVRLTGKRTMLLVQTDKHDGNGVYRRTALFIMSRIFNIERVISPLKNSRSSHNSIFTYVPFVISPAVCKNRFSNNKIHIMTVGKFQPRKGHILLLKTFKRLIEEGGDAHLTIVAQAHDDTEEENIRTFVKNHNLNEHVTILTHLSHDQVRERYCEHDLFVLPSWNEPAAFSPLEAMAAGLPVIVSDTCGTKCYIEEGVNGYIFKSKDEEDLFDKIKQIMATDSLKFGRQSLRIVNENHSLDNYAKTINTIL